MFLRNEKFSLVVDIGGTKTAFAVIDSTGKILYKKMFVSSEIKYFTDTIIHFLQLPECKSYKIKEACIAVAGPINSQRNYARPTNLDWIVDTNNILVRTPLHNVLLINDFEAIGFGIDLLKQENYVEWSNVIILIGFFIYEIFAFTCPYPLFTA